MTGPFEILPEIEDEEVKRLFAEVDRLEGKDAPEGSAPAPEALGPDRLVYTFGEPLPLIYQHAFVAMGDRAFVGAVRWVHFHRVDRTAGLFAAFHAFAPPHEMELVVFGNPGMLKRSVLRCLAAYAFRDLGLRRLSVRFRAGEDDLQDIARRAGFLPEGTARSFYADGSDCSVWAMTAERCPWLIAPPIAAPDFTPPSGTVH